MGAGVLSAALVETAIISYRDIAQVKVLPLPADFAAVAIVYGLLGMFPDSAGSVPAMIAWGFVVATLLNLWNPSTPLSKPALKTPQQAAQGVTA